MTAYHNTCRHRGAELCAPAGQPVGRLITCLYHVWSYAAADGRLVSNAHAQPGPDFDFSEHGLHRVATKLRNGFIFPNPAAAPGDLRADLPLDRLNNWPVDSLFTGHRRQSKIACN